MFHSKNFSGKIRVDVKFNKTFSRMSARVVD